MMGRDVAKDARLGCNMPTTSAIEKSSRLADFSNRLDSLARRAHDLAGGVEALEDRLIGPKPTDACAAGTPPACGLCGCLDQSAESLTAALDRLDQAVTRLNTVVG